MGLIVLAVVVVGLAAVAFVGLTMMRSDPTLSHSIPGPDTPTVALTGEVLMTHYDGLHHAVTGHITVRQNRELFASTTVREDNTFTTQIPASLRGPIDVQLGLHGGSVAVVEADGEDLHAVVIYNPVNNFFA